MKESLKNKLKKIVLFIINPRLLFCFAIAWFVTNGWSYVMLGLGTYLNIGWMCAVAGTYLAFLWFPFSPEKIVTFGLAIVLLRFLFPNDTKTLAILRDWYAKAVENIRHRKKKQDEKGNEDSEK